MGEVLNSISHEDNYQERLRQALEEKARLEAEHNEAILNKNEALIERSEAELVRINAKIKILEQGLDALKRSQDKPFEDPENQ